MYTVLIILILIISLLIYYYLINIYEVKIFVFPKTLYADNKSTVTISVIPINALGNKAFFRSAYAEFKITEGNNLVDVVSIKNKEGKITLRAGNKTGKVVVIVKSDYALLPSVVEINVEPDLAENIK